MTDRETNTAPAIPTAELDRLATEAGMQTLLFYGPGSCVWSTGCNGVLAEHLERFAELVAARAVAAPAAQGATQELPEPVARCGKGEGAFFVKWTNRGKSLRGQINLYTEADLLAERAKSAPVGQAEDAARYRWLRATTNWVSSEGKRIDVRNNPALWDAAIDASIARAQQAGQAETGEPK